VQVGKDACTCFLPYASQLADYLDLLAAVEDSCQYLNQRVAGGYPPPYDPQVTIVSLTPDPGVLEVNSLPRALGRTQQIHTVLFEEARGNRLTAEKFGYDGSHMATGGGSHIVIGERPCWTARFWPRPNLLRSMLTILQNHPLSRIFFRMYVGPTSQSPRVDEAARMPCTNWRSF